MPYELQVERAARRELERLPQRAYERLEQAIDSLVAVPRPRGARKVRGTANLWRIRVGEYRAVYAVFDRENLVKIVRVMRRTSRTYEGLS